MNTFEKALEYVFGNEGGYSNDKNDKGGETKYGISLRFLKGLKEGDINGDGQIDGGDIAVLSKKKAEEIYENHFWLLAKCNEIKSERVAIKLFDMAVNFGVRTAIRMLQGVVGTKQDGIIGKNTKNKIEEKTEEELLKGLVEACKDRYERIVIIDDSQRRFYKGWMRRAERIPN